MGEALKSLIIGAKKLIHRTNAMWDILLAREEGAKLLAGSILKTKS